MDFFRYQTFFDCYEADGQTGGRTGVAWLELFTRSVRRQLPAETADHYVLKANAECCWMEEGRPCFCLGSELFPLVQQQSLEFDCSLLSLPVPQFEVRFPRPQGFAVGNSRIESMFLTEMLVAGGRGLGIWCNAGLKATHFRNYSAPHYWLLSLETSTLEEALDPFCTTSDNSSSVIDVLRGALMVVGWLGSPDAEGEIPALEFQE